jgi:hypothetical protein
MVTPTCQVPKYEVTSSHALCIDGSNPAYYFREGFGNGKNKFHIHFEGGGWCYTPKSCEFRAKTVLGSSSSYPSCQIPNKNNWAPYLSNSQEENPNLFDYNTVFVRYCDGGSYAGDSDVEFEGKTLHFRGKNIREAIINDLLASKGLSKASDVLISGCSAGALAVLLGIDQLAEQIQQSAGLSVKVRGLIDSGFFLEFSHGKDKFDSKMTYQEALTPTGALDYSYAMREVFEFMNLTGGTNQACVAARSVDSKASDCIFAGKVSKFINSPLYFIQVSHSFCVVLLLHKILRITFFCSRSMIPGNYGMFLAILRILHQ